LVRQTSESGGQRGNQVVGGVRDPINRISPQRLLHTWCQLLHRIVFDHKVPCAQAYRLDRLGLSTLAGENEHVGVKAGVPELLEHPQPSPGSRRHLQVEENDVVGALLEPS
jgi:hypothetical protein